MPKNIFKNITKRQKLFGLSVIITLITIMGVALYMRTPELFNPGLQLGAITRSQTVATQQIQPIFCIGARCTVTVKIGCAYNNPSCNANQNCVNNKCVAKSGCAYNNPSCNANQNCVNNKCVTKSGCAYNNPSCNVYQACSINKCVAKSGCAYNNPSCNANQNCVDNVCQSKIGCEYGNPSCNANQDCMNNQCVTKQGCTYNNPACPTDSQCVNNVCQTKKCTDGTLYGQCANEKPKYCDDGNLINKCSICGCLSGIQCQADENCIKPLDYNLTYSIPEILSTRGIPSSTFDFQVGIFCEKNGYTMFCSDLSPSPVFASVTGKIINENGAEVLTFNLLDRGNSIYGNKFEANFSPGMYSINIEIKDAAGKITNLNKVSDFSLIPSANVKCEEVIRGYNNPNENRINVVFVGVNYPSITLFQDYINKIIDTDGVYGGIYSLELFKSNNNKFNFYYVNQIQTEESYQSVTNLGWSLSTGCELQNKLEIILDNSIFVSGGGQDLREIGGSFMIGHALVSFTKGDSHDIRTVLHEAMGHALAGLSDEYNYSSRMGNDYEIASGNQQCYMPPANLLNCYNKTLDDGTVVLDCESTPESKADCENNSPWKDLIGNGCGKDGIIDCDETDPNYVWEITCNNLGCMYPNFYRSNSGSFMVGPYYGFNLPSQRQICKTIKDLTGSSSGICNQF